MNPFDERFPLINRVVKFLDCDIVPRFILALCMPALQQAGIV